MSMNYRDKLCLLAVILLGVAAPSGASADPAANPPAAAAPLMDNATKMDNSTAMDNAIAAALAPLTVERYVYESSARRDPFMPLLTDKKVPAPSAARPNRAPRAHSPLEEPDLSAIALKGIVADAKKTYAVVDINGKTFVITVGTYIGNDGGRVIKINADNLVVETLKYDDTNKEFKLYQTIPLRKEDQE
ncbi:MAG: pilus assembly protein PilP [Candidatus Magnetominusculus sp. LBB02]|nr:pilus assembly protein PilP [Candidatus Magnetominusculus sp. LBB02]